MLSGHLRLLATIFPRTLVALCRAALKLGHYRVDRMIVHRLDMATSGCVIMARTDAGLKDLNRQVLLVNCTYPRLSSKLNRKSSPTARLG